MAGIKLPKPKSAGKAKKFMTMGRNLSTQAPTNMFNPKPKSKFKKAPKRR